MKLPLLATAFGLVSGAAFAADLGPAPMQPQVMTPVVADADWSGGYAGLSLGYGDADISVDEIEPIELGAEGILGGAFAGYQRDFGAFVLGGELDLNAADIDAELSGELSEFADIGDAELKIDRIHRLKLRAGYDAGDALVYGVAGLAYASVEGSVEGFSDDASDTGAVFGGGVDVRISPAVTLGSEVLYHDFSDFDDSGVDAEVVTFQARVAYQF